MGRGGRPKESCLVDGDRVALEVVALRVDEAVCTAHALSRSGESTALQVCRSRLTRQQAKPGRGGGRAGRGGSQ